MKQYRERRNKSKNRVQNDSPVLSRHSISNGTQQREGRDADRKGARQRSRSLVRTVFGKSTVRKSKRQIPVIKTKSEPLIGQIEKSRGQIQKCEVRFLNHLKLNVTRGNFIRM